MYLCALQVWINYNWKFPLSFWTLEFFLNALEQILEKIIHRSLIKLTCKTAWFKGFSFLKEKIFDSVFNFFCGIPFSALYYSFHVHILSFLLDWKFLEGIICLIYLGIRTQNVKECFAQCNANTLCISYSTLHPHSTIYSAHSLWN